jgi:hypothetical protein
MNKKEYKGGRQPTTPNTYQLSYDKAFVVVEGPSHSRQQSICKRGGRRHGGKASANEPNGGKASAGGKQHRRARGWRTLGWGRGATPPQEAVEAARPPARSPARRGPAARRHRHARARWRTPGWGRGAAGSSGSGNAKALQMWENRIHTRVGRTWTLLTRRELCGAS